MTNNDTINNVVMINVVLDREEVRKVGDEVRVLTEEEKDILKTMKRMISNKKTLIISSFKTMDKKKIKEKVIQIKGVMHNIINDGMKIGEVNRALSVGAYLVADSLGKIKSKVESKKKEKGKLLWQRRVERNIGEWQKDLGRVEEIRKGTKLKAEVMSRLVDKYDLIEKGCLVVLTFINKLQFPLILPSFVFKVSKN